MDLWHRQVAFAAALPGLLLEAQRLGYKYTIGHAWCCPDCNRSIKNLLHRERLAIDLHLFDGDRYIKTAEGHDKLHDYWESIGGRKRNSKYIHHYAWNRS